MITMAIQWLLAYLIGSLSGAMILGRLRGVDIRDSGSGNAGATNALRTRGKAFAFGVLLIDLGKGALAAGLLPKLLFGLDEPPTTTLQSAIGCAIAATLGHVYPIFYGFRGGKGAATLVGATLTIFPLVVPLLLAVWIGVIVLTGYVGAATVSAGVSMPLFLAWLADGPARPDLLLFGCLAALLVAFTHRSNIVRLLRGQENRFDKAMFWKRSS